LPAAIEVREAPTAVPQIIDVAPKSEMSAGSLAWTSRIEARLAALQPAPLVANRERRLEQRLHRIVDAPETRSTVAMHVRDLEDGKVLFDQRGGWHLNPASNQKILTAHAAVELLGPDYRFETTLLRHGETLVFRGEGDPSLTLSDLDSLARSAQARGELAGVRRIVVDESAFGPEHFAPGVEEHDGEAAYLAPTGAASLNFNTVEIVARPGLERGAPVRVELFPPSPSVEVVNRARTGKGALRVASHRADDGHTIVEVDGEMRPGAPAHTTRRRIHDPASFVGGALSHMVAELEGVSAPDVFRGESPAEARLVAQHESRGLVHVLAASMKYSSNFTTEQVLRTLAWRASGEPGSWSSGVALLKRFAESVSAVEDEAHFVNGSGLSHAGRVSPRLLVDLLTLSAHEGSPSEALLASYARPGGEGTMHYRNPAAGARVRAKTGTLAGVSALSGVVFSRDGSRKLAFSLLVNGADATDSRQMQDRAVLELLAWLDN
jgi:D-alanyl-D-alanine carboxypeptidase/D-alanyl-D-alanine-endopeptidase (penicillin-binding protein 4)